jgi:hypothetical protein
MNPDRKEAPMRARTLVLAAVVALPLSACADRDLPTTPRTDALAPSLQLSQDVVVTGSLIQVTNEAYNEYHPRIDGDIVVFTVSTEGGQNVAYVDLVTGERRQITSGDRNQRLQDVSGRRIVYADYSTWITEVVIYDIDTGTPAAVSSEEGGRNQPAIKGDRVAYQQAGSTAMNIAVTDLMAGLTT